MSKPQAMAPSAVGRSIVIQHLDDGALSRAVWAQEVEELPFLDILGRPRRRAVSLLNLMVRPLVAMAGPSMNEDD